MDLVALIARQLPHDGSVTTSIPGLDLYRESRPQPPGGWLYRPSLCIVAQGAKRVRLGDELFVYDANRFLLVAADVPVTTQVITASTKNPYLALRLVLDPALVADAIAEVGPAERAPTERALVVSEIDEGLIDAVARLVALLDEHELRDALTPLVQREIVHRLLAGPQGSRLRQIVAGDSQAQRVTRALRWLQSHFAEPLRVDRLAKEVRMSPSALHHHFKSVTAMSPLQYQKSLRLREARRLMLGEGLDAAEASFRVGYESPSQFSREYRRAFGAPPKRDVATLRDAAGA